MTSFELFGGLLYRLVGGTFIFGFGNCYTTFINYVASSVAS